MRKRLFPFVWSCVFALVAGATSAWAADEAPIATQAPTPKSSTTQYVRVPFEKAENEVLRLFQQDLVNLEKIAPSIAIYDVTTSGSIPPAYANTFKAKLERALLFSKRIKLKACPQCGQSRLVRTEDGQLHYETQDSDSQRPAKIASDLGVTYLLTANLTYTTEDLELRIHVIDAPQNEIVLVRNYSAADVVHAKEALVATQDTEMGINEGESLSHVIIGQIAFATVLSVGSTSLPTINTGSGSSRFFIPSVDLLIGEKYARGYKRFGFNFSLAFNTATADPDRVGTPVPFLLRVGPQYRYTFNPYNVSSVRFSIQTEAGVAISTGFTSGYVAVGPEFGVPQMFSVSINPMYIVPGTVQSPSLQVQQADGSFKSMNTGTSGTFGGFGLQLKGNINF